MQPLFEHHPEVAGWGTRALEREGDGPPVLLLHGYSDSADTWRLVLDALGRRGQRAVALDLPGFGRADPLHDDEPVVPQLVRFAAAAGEELFPGEAAPVVVGNSLGGLTALLLAERRPAPTAVVPIGPAGFDHPRWFRIIQRDPVLRRLLASPVPVPAPVLRWASGEVFRQLAFARPRGADPDVLARFGSHLGTREQLLRVLATGNRMLPELDRPFDHGALGCPVLLAWGEHDRMVHHSGSRHLAAAVPGLRYELLPGLGHCPQLEDPERVAELVLEGVALGTGAAVEVEPAAAD